MKKVLLLMFLLMPALMWAQKMTKMLVWTSEKEYVAFEISDMPKIEFMDETMRVMAGDMSLTLKTDQKIRFTFDDDQFTDIDDATMAAQCAIGANGLSLSGAKQGSAVAVYDMSGALKAHATVGAGGEVSISTEGWQKGVYAVKGEGFSFKFMK